MRGAGRNFVPITDLISVFDTFYRNYHFPLRDHSHVVGLVGMFLQCRTRRIRSEQHITTFGRKFVSIKWALERGQAT